MSRYLPAPTGAVPAPGEQRPGRLLPRLTSLRAPAAVAVYVVHLEAHGVASLPWGVSAVGGTGVAFFFVLSGFVLAWGTRPGLPARTFYRRRLARVYPSDLATLLVAIVVPVVSVNRDARAAVANALMLQAWSTDNDVVYGMNGVSWSLSCEAFFYALFPLAVVVVRRLPHPVVWTLVVLGLLLAVVAYQVAPDRADHLPPVRAAEFVLGLVAGLYFRDGWRPRVPSVVVGAALALGVVLSTWLESPVSNVVMAVPFLLLVLHVAQRDLTGRRGGLTSRAAVLAGEVSFAFYLVHELVIVNLLPVLPADPALQLLVISPVCVAAAVALHLVVERPCHRLLRDRPGSLALAPTGGAAAAGLGPRP
ncbi:acyltransferase family protein [Nocardioides aurantiacus]|uniref:Peptidoglycan/LPS O-acetylase OafA/YrhL n=1 Tax=Nocardioides aurantiacus TaxID=86796 RepID=A0A3N2CVC7_9ACTN|nr:acyltransferase [Nocardioides aurantiacus]ROR91378.1 peptidoglycan/LPS O-acetylase OafA/YrhL [Nocardioides aurantiacus]